MKINRFTLVLGIVLLFVIAASLAEDLPVPGYFCETDADCEELSIILIEFEEIDKPYLKCNVNTEICYDPGTSEATTAQATTATNATIGTTTSTTATTAPSPILSTQVTQLKTELAALTTRINSLEANENVFNQQLTGLNAELQALSGNLQNLEQVKGELNAVAVGLAGLQENLDNTTSEVAAIEANLDKKSARNRTIGIFFVIILVLVVFGLLAHYMTGKKKPFGRKVDPKIVSYITNYIKQGWKYPNIKTKLMGSGWPEQAIQWAYKETIKNNYNKYKQNGTGRKVSSSKQPEVGADKKKMVTIAVVSVLLLVGAVLIINGTTGNAIFFEKTVSENNEVGYDFQCTPPHVLNPDKDGCCLDFDNSGRCDYIEANEKIVGQVSSGDSCTSSLQCQHNEYCISGTCQTLESQYKGLGDCSKQCNTYAVKVSTSDGETYPSKPGQGSYTGAGAIEWKVLDGPTHCKGEPAFVPIRITRKDTNGIINIEHFALKQGETIPTITHPNVPSVSFELTIDRIFEWCPE
jgi:hypothetical protein